MPASTPLSSEVVDNVTLALAVLNLLLVVVGALLTYFDWGAARRREILYISFTEERPGASYWDTARRRRGQYSHLLIAFLILIIPRFVPAVSTELAKLSQAALYCLEMLGWTWLAFGFFYSFSFSVRRQAGRVLGVMALFFVVGWLLFALLFREGASGKAAPDYVTAAEIALRFLLVFAVVAMALRYRGRPTQPGLLDFNPSVVAAAFVIWLISSVIAWPTNYLVKTFLLNPPESELGLPVSLFFLVVAHMLLIALVAHGVLTEYESVERSRHRMGRERQVIFKLLQRSGAAFTTAIEESQVHHIILETALEATAAQAGAIYVYKRETRLIEPVDWKGFFPPMYVDTPAAALSPHRSDDLEKEMRHQTFHMGEGVIGEVMQSGHAQIIDNVTTAGVMLGTTAEYLRNRSLLVVPLRIRDEPLGVLAVLNKQGGFSKDDQSLLQALADQGALAINNAMLTIDVGERARLHRELQIARDIQQRLLPKQCPIIPGFEIAARATSATEVGGDYYDFFWVDDNHLGIMVADVSGKGVHAALVVAMIRSAFRTQAHGNPDVGDVLARVNEFMSQDLRRDMFITCVYGILEISTSRFSWARAGHEPIIVAHSSNEVDIISPNGFALGVIGSPEFGELLEVNTLQLNSGDRLWIYTDGLTEAMSPSGEEFGLERILQVVSHAADVPYESSSNGHSARNGHAQNGHVGQAVSQTSDASRADEFDVGSGRLALWADLSVYDPEDLQAMDRAVSLHVGTAAQSDDLTIVYLAAK